MATGIQTEALTVAAPTGQHLASFKTFLQKCEDKGFLQRQQELQADDVCDGINDEATLMYQPL
jgi:hypothetical protein